MAFFEFSAEFIQDLLKYVFLTSPPSLETNIGENAVVDDDIQFKRWRINKSGRDLSPFILMISITLSSSAC